MMLNSSYNVMKRKNENEFSSVFATRLQQAIEIEGKKRDISSMENFSFSLRCMTSSTSLTMPLLQQYNLHHVSVKSRFKEARKERENE